MSKIAVMNPEDGLPEARVFGDPATGRYTVFEIDAHGRELKRYEGRSASDGEIRSALGQEQRDGKLGKIEVDLERLVAAASESLGFSGKNQYASVSKKPMTVRQYALLVQHDLLEMGDMAFSDAEGEHIPPEDLLARAIEDGAILSLSSDGSEKPVVIGNFSNPSAEVVKARSSAAEIEVLRRVYIVLAAEYPVLNARLAGKNALGDPVAAERHFSAMTEGLRETADRGFLFGPDGCFDATTLERQLDLYTLHLQTQGIAPGVAEKKRRLLERYRDASTVVLEFAREADSYLTAWARGASSDPESFRRAVHLLSAAISTEASWRKTQQAHGLGQPRSNPPLFYLVETLDDFVAADTLHNDAGFTRVTGAHLLACSIRGRVYGSMGALLGNKSDLLHAKELRAQTSRSESGEHGVTMLQGAASAMFAVGLEAPEHLLYVSPNLFDEVGYAVAAPEAEAEPSAGP